MTRSRFILLTWISLAMGTFTFYAHSLIAMLVIHLGPVRIHIQSSITCYFGGARSGLLLTRLTHNELSDDFGLDPFHLHWSRLSLGEFEIEHVTGPNEYSYLTFPLWLPFILSTLILLPLYFRYRRQFSNGAQQPNQ